MEALLLAEEGKHQVSFRVSWVVPMNSDRERQRRVLMSVLPLQRRRVDDKLSLFWPWNWRMGMEKPAELASRCACLCSLLGCSRLREFQP